MAKLQFTVRVDVSNPGMLEELRARVDDFRPAYEAIYSEWVKVNEDKFSAAKGRESSGADVDGEFWAALTPEYIAAKHPDGAPKRRKTKTNAQGYKEFPDWLMVRSGELMDAMTNPDALFHMFQPGMATFGTPNDPGLADIVQWQAGARQKNRPVVFLGDTDRKSIQRIVQDYLSMGGDFEAKRFALGLAAVNQESEIESMDAEFSDSVGE